MPRLTPRSHSAPQEHKTSMQGFKASRAVQPTAWKFDSFAASLAKEPANPGTACRPARSAVQA
jgi:hypothetical protein